MQSVSSKRVTILLGLLILLPFFIGHSARTDVRAETTIVFPKQTGTLWSPYLEWSLSNSTYSGNPYDLIATVTFTHLASGERRTTGMFFDGNNTWKFRFAGTRTGDWRFTTNSSDAELNGHTGTLTITPNDGAPGFVSHTGDKWVRTGTNQAFVPQFVMVSGPQNYVNDYGRIDDEIQTFIVGHGFNGFHTPVFCRWFDVNQPVCGSSTNPDPRTFVALEQMITRVYAAGGVVHIWMWGDDAREQNPNFLPGGINGSVDRRLQRYIAARLGALPGWTMGYGFDLFEWVNGSQLSSWHNYMQARLGWEHMLGARANKNQLTQLSEALDYSSYEQHQPDYDMYVQTIATRPSKPSFSEDRFRIRNEGQAKDYTMVETRRGLWASAMAGGVANIWGNLWGDTSANDGSGTSRPYPNPEWIKTYALFINSRFTADMFRCNQLTNGVCLQRPTNAAYIFYGENVTSLQMNLSGMNGAQPAIAVDAAGVYAEIDLGTLSATNQTWNAPYRSDWAIAIGNIGQFNAQCISLGANQAHANHTTTDLNAGNGQLGHRIYFPMITNHYCP